MRDVKNFSTLGKINEKYIEEAAEFSMSSSGLEEENIANDGGRVATSAKRRRLAWISSAAAGFLVLSLCAYVGVMRFGRRDGASSDMMNAEPSFTETVTETMPDVADGNAQDNAWGEMDGNAQGNTWGEADGEMDGEMETVSNSSTQSESDSQASSSDDEEE